MRRIPLIVSLFAIVPFGLIAMGRTGPTAAQDGTPMADGQRFVGSWRVTAISAQGSPELSLATFGADGIAITSPQPVFPASDALGETIFTSAGHGAWVATGPDTAILTFVVLIADGQGTPLLTATARATATLGVDGLTFTGEGTRTFADPGGNTVATEAVTVRATRILAAAPEMPTAATPAR